MSKKKKNKKRQKKLEKKLQAKLESSDVLVAPQIHRGGDRLHQRAEQDVPSVSVAEKEKSPIEVVTPSSKTSSSATEVGDTVSDVLEEAVKPTKDVHVDQEKEKTHKHVHHQCQSPILRKKIKNLTSFAIVLGGLSAGMLFVDVAQFFTQRGLSAKALGEAQIVDYDGSTWVKYDEPRVFARVFSSEESTPQVQEKVEKVLSALAFFMPTLEVQMIDIDTPRGKREANEVGLGYAPAVVFDPSLKENAYYSQTDDLFVSRENGEYVLRMDQVEVTVDHYVDAPAVDAGMIVGVSEAPHSVVVFENFLCQDCAGIHTQLTALQTQYPEKLKVVYKNIPDFSDEASRAGAYAGHCAYAQGKYEAYAQILFTNDAWKDVESDVRSDLFSEYAGFIPEFSVESFMACYKDRQYDQQMVRDITEADYFGISQTPTVFIDGEIFSTHSEDTPFFDELGSVLENVIDPEPIVEDEAIELEEIDATNDSL